jgi:secreted PhoX family phosphatase
MATGDKYLDSGKLYVAKFNADGTGPVARTEHHQPDGGGLHQLRFADQADVCVNSRLAADAVGATKMDRPEWCSVNPANGEIYFTLTNNSNRRVDPTGSSQLAPDSANPRAYTDIKGTARKTATPTATSCASRKSAGSAATSFTWDVYLFGAQTGADPARSTCPT